MGQAEVLPKMPQSRMTQPPRIAPSRDVESRGTRGARAHFYGTVWFATRAEGPTESPALWRRLAVSGAYWFFVDPQLCSNLSSRPRFLLLSNLQTFNLLLIDSCLCTPIQLSFPGAL